MKTGDKYDYQHPTSIWESVKNTIEIAIIKGEFSTASKLPSISEMSETYNIGRTTAKKILEELFKDGIITKQQGVGFFVKPNVREKLKRKHTNEIEKQIRNIVAMANLIGYEKKHLHDYIEEVFESDCMDN